MNSPLITFVALAWMLPLLPNSEPEKEPEPPTIKSLEGQVPDVRVSEAPTKTAAQALEEYEQFLKVSTGDPLLQAEASRRLADLYLQLGEDRMLALNLPMADDPYHQNAIRLYNEILENPDYDKTGFILYQLAKAYENVGQQDDALNALNRFVSEYPDNEYFDDAQFRRGELFFVRKDYASAEQAYASILASGSESGFYEQSLYKHGWSLFKEGIYDEATDSFLTLADIKLEAESEAALARKIENMTRPERELYEDTFRVLSLIFSYELGAESIDLAMAEHSQSHYAYLLYVSLAELYLEKERYLDAANAYETFAADYPNHIKSPMFQDDAIEAYKQGRFPTLVLEAKQRYVATYGLDSEYWNSFDPNDRPDVVTALKSNLADLAQYEHARAQETKDPEIYALAAGWYRRSLQYFPDDPESAERSFLLGEVLTESKQFDLATESYDHAAYDYPGFEKASEAGYAAILSARDHYKSLDGSTATTWHREQLKQGLRFAMSWPEHEQAGAVLTDIAEEYFELGMFDAASIVAGEVVTKQPPVDRELQRVAWTVVAHSRFDSGVYRQSEKAYQNLLALNMVEGDERLELEERVAASVYRQAEASQAAGDVDAAVESFMRVAAAAPDSSIKSNSVYDAATLLINSERWEESIPILEQYRAQYPNDERADDITQKLAYSYKQAGRSLKAANELEQVAMIASVDSDVHREALWEAAELYQKEDDVNSAKRVYAEFVDRFPDPMSESLEARYRLSEMAKAAGDTNARERWVREIIEQDADAVANGERTDRSKYLAAIGSLEFAEPYWDEFVAVKLTAPLKKSLKTKTARMDAALKVYNGAAEYGVAEVTTAATYRIADLYYQLSVDLIGSERPDGLNTEELDQYEMLLEEQAFPFEEDAIALFEVNIARAADGLYDDNVKKSYARLATLMPGRYAKDERSESYAAHLE